jgi:AcrR family transcriptional regulator
MSGPELIARVNSWEETRLKMAKERSSKRPRVRLGRPPKDLAGDVKNRILDAAQQVFLKRGFQGASIDEIAATAPASKPTIYAHFPGKEALFAAIVARIIDGLADFTDYVPKGHTVQDRLMNLGIEILERFIDETVDVARVTIAESGRFPELSCHVHDAAHERADKAVARLLSEAIGTPGRASKSHASKGPTSKGPFSAKRSVATTRIFLDLILLPMFMRSLIGGDAKTLRKETLTFVRERVRFFLAACETDWDH